MIENLLIEACFEPYRPGLEDGFAPSGCSINPPKKPYLEVFFGQQWLQDGDCIVSLPFGRIVLTAKQVEALKEQSREAWKMRFTAFLDDFKNTLLQEGEEDNDPIERLDLTRATTD